MLSKKQTKQSKSNIKFQDFYIHAVAEEPSFK